MTIKVADKLLLDSVIAGLNYKPCKELLVKPLPANMVQKEFTVPVETGEVDEEGFKSYDTEVEVQEVESSLREGIILAVPDQFKDTYMIGQHIVFPMKYAYSFDLFKDALLVKAHDIIGWVLTNDNTNDEANRN